MDDETPDPTSDDTIPVSDDDGVEIDDVIDDEGIEVVDDADMDDEVIEVVDDELPDDELPDDEVVEVVADDDPDDLDEEIVEEVVEEVIEVDDELVDSVTAAVADTGVVDAAAPAAPADPEIVEGDDEQDGLDPREPRPYDFRRPNKLSRDHQRALQVVQETFGRQWGTLLNSTLRAPATVTVDPLGQCTYSEYISPLPNPTHLVMLNLDPLPGTVLLHLPSNLALTLIEMLTGGRRPTGHEARPLTEIEQALMRAQVDRMLPELKYAFETVSDINPEFLDAETNPQFAQTSQPSDMVVVFNYTVSVGEVSAVVSLCLPYDTISPALEALVGHTMFASRSSSSAQRDRDTMLQLSEQIPLTTVVHLPARPIAAASLLDLAVGDVIALDHFTGDTVDLTCDGVVMATGTYGQARNRAVFQVLRTFRDELNDNPKDTPR